MLVLSCLDWLLNLLMFFLYSVIGLEPRQQQRPLTTLCAHATSASHPISVEKVPSQKSLQICRNTNDIFDRCKLPPQIDLERAP